MFRALLCSSSGGQIVLVQHLVSSLSLGDCSVHRLREDERILVTCVLNSHLKRVTIPDAVLIQFDLLKMSIIVLETCRVIYMKYIKIKNLCIKLVKKNYQTLIYLTKSADSRGQEASKTFMNILP